MTASDVSVAEHDVTPQEMANALRALAMDAVEAAQSGHPGMPMGMADAATVLFSRHLRFDAADPRWPDRDRFVLSAGHGSMLLYGLLHLTGYGDLEIDQLRRFRQLGSRTAGHPEYGHAAGIETTTGPLGQGLANAVGMAIAERHLAARFGADLVDHRTYVIAGDGCLMEGISHEAASLAGHLGLGRLIVLFDDNAITIDGPTDLSVGDDQLARFAALGWHVAAVDGHDEVAVDRALHAAKAATAAPSLIACQTHIGYGAPNKQDSASAHGAPLGAEEVAGARARLGWQAAPFDVPAPVQDAWSAVGARGAGPRQAWLDRLARQPAARREDFWQAQAQSVPAAAYAALEAHKAALIAAPAKVATRKASGDLLDAIAPALPALIGGSADLTGSNNTRAKDLAPLTRDDYGGRYLFYGVREHAMAAAMNGMALHGGIIPYGGTFLVFTDYARPAIRLSALIGLGVIYVMTHDSIGLGEDGPTHQPIEHLAALRAMPNLDVYRPADAVETAECWALALANRRRPSILALSRQGLEPVRTRPRPDNPVARGAYELAAAEAEARVSLFATGSEVAIAMAARATLQAAGVATRVVSLPCWEHFWRQDAAWRDAVLGPPDALRIGIEAGIVQGWERLLGPDGIFIGMDGFGASAPGAALFDHFGITAAAVVAAAQGRL